MRFLRALTFVSLFMVQGLAAEPPAGLSRLPELKSRITDPAGALDAADETLLERKLELLEKEKGSQVVVVIINSTDGEAIEQYSMRLAEAWKIGRKGADDGVILLLAKQDRKIRMEVGYGLEGAIPDVEARRIIDLVMVPRLREGNFFQAVSGGVDAIEERIRAEPLAPVQSAEPAQPPGFLSEAADWVVMMSFRFMFLGRWILMAAGIWLLFARKTLGGLGLALAGQILLILPIQIMYGFFSFFPFRDVILYTAGYLLAYAYLRRNRPAGGDSSGSGSSSYSGYRSSRSSSSSSTRSSSSSSSSSRSSSSSSSSRSYSGGGGSFGGGGASGSW